MIDAYLVALESAGERGFSPVGMLYANILIGYCNRGLMRTSSGSNSIGTFWLTDAGREELAKQRAAATK
jgi:hypothetical protein